MIPNLRDVGETVNILLGEEYLNEGVLFRGGTVNNLFSNSELPPVNCILNLRLGKDKRFERVRQLHIPAIDRIENYNTSNGRVRKWINQVFSTLTIHENYPILIHCTSGKDRTGVIIALILLVIGIDRSTIIEEYLESEGIKGSEHIIEAMNEVGDINSYLYTPHAAIILKRQLLQQS